MNEPLHLAERIRLYLAWCESPEFQPCPRCSGKGYHHGFGEQGHDPDWCVKCGGPGEEPTEPGTWNPDDLLREALGTLEIVEAVERIARAEAAIFADAEPMSFADGCRSAYLNIVAQITSRRRVE